MKLSLHSLFAALVGIVLAFAIPVPEAEAKRLGGGKSSGMQRQALPQKPAPQRNAEQPARNNDAAAAPAGAAGAAGAAAKGGARSWLGPVASIAAGLGLAALASHLGLGEEFASFLLIALLVVAAILLFRWFSSRSRPAPAMQYAGAGAGPAANPGVTAFTGGPAMAGAASPSAHESTHAAGEFPPGFDADAFARQAKLNFLRLQAANDAGNLDDLREFTTPELFAEIQLQLAERGAAEQRTEVEWLEADVLECAEEANRHIVSVRFTGRIREDRDAPASGFVEVWHLTRPADGSRGWVVAGIQQMDA